MTPMPKVNSRRPYKNLPCSQESLSDWVRNNTNSVEWFLENAEELRILIEKKTKASHLQSLRKDIEDLAIAFGRTGNIHVADQLYRMERVLQISIEDLTGNVVDKI